MTTLREALRNVERARAARDDARAAMLKHIERQRRTEIETGSWSPIDAKTTALAQAVEDARRELRQAEAALAVHAPAHIAALAGDRAKIVKAALAAIAALEKAELADRALMAEHAWARPPATIGELPFQVTALRARLEAALRELEPTPTRRIA